MTLRILHVLAALEEEIRPDIPDTIRGGFYEKGLEKMRKYLVDVEVDDYTLDTLVDNLDKHFTHNSMPDYRWTSMRWDDIEDALVFVVDDWVEKNAHWKDVAATPWFEEISALIRQIVGYVDDGSNEFRSLPANLPYLQKGQIIANESDLIEHVLDGLRAAEEQFLEDAVRGFLREFQEGYVEKPEEQKQEVQKEDEDTSGSDFLDEPADYSGRFAHAVV
jgi:hypothetical protein